MQARRTTGKERSGRALSDVAVAAVWPYLVAVDRGWPFLPSVDNLHTARVETSHSLRSRHSSCVDACSANWSARRRQRYQSRMKGNDLLHSFAQLDRRGQ